MDFLKIIAMILIFLGIIALVKAITIHWKQEKRYNSIIDEVVKSQKDSFYKSATLEQKRMFTQCINKIVRTSDLDRYDEKNRVALLAMEAMMLYSAYKHRDNSKSL